MKYGGPPDRLAFDSGEHTVSHTGVLWRLYKAGGVHPTTWDSMRYHGPIPGMRFDPHPPPTGRKHRGVMYVTSSPITAFAEVFQQSRVIDARLGAGAPNYTLAAWHPIRPLILIDLIGSDFFHRNGQAHALAVGPKGHTQEWARLIDQCLGDTVDGLISASPVWGEPMITLFERAVLSPSFPSAPDFNRPLGDPGMTRLLGRVRTVTKHDVAR